MPDTCPSLVPAPLLSAGRNFYSRYDYEGVESDAANNMIKHLEEVIAKSKKGEWGAGACARAGAKLE